MASSGAAGAFPGVLNGFWAEEKSTFKFACLVNAHSEEFVGLIIKARTIIGTDVTAFAFIDDMTFN